MKQILFQLKIVRKIRRIVTISLQISFSAHQLHGLFSTSGKFSSEKSASFSVCPKKVIPEQLFTSSLLLRLKISQDVKPFSSNNSAKQYPQSMIKRSNPSMEINSTLKNSAKPMRLSSQTLLEKSFMKQLQNTKNSFSVFQSQNSEQSRKSSKEKDSTLFTTNMKMLS